MAHDTEAKTLSVEEIAALNAKLSEMRHNINNSLSMIVAASELIRRKPEVLDRMAETISLQPQRITKEMQAFSAEFERALGINRGDT